jgi:hypothetical protein
LVGIWALDEGFQIVQLLVRSDGRYRIDKTSTDPDSDFSFAELGRYQLQDQTLVLTPYEYLGEPQSRRYEYQLTDDSLSLISADNSLVEVYQFESGSRDDVLEQEKVEAVLVGTWERSIVFAGKDEYTFRPGGYYVLKYTHEDDQFPPEFTRGRYEHDGVRLSLKPYGGVEAPFELDFFGSTLTLIESNESFGQSETFDLVAGSRAEVLAKAAEAEAFLAGENWQVGVWEIRDEIHLVDVTIRPDGHYIAKEDTEFLAGIVRGRYTLEPRRIHLCPFVGQGLYARSNGEFGKVERVRELDYYDGELQFIDAEAFFQSVTIARKRPGSEAPVIEKVLQAELERGREGWAVGLWDVNDPAGWMEFTLRPDHRYIAKSGNAGLPGEVERGRYLVGHDKATLAPYEGLGAPRGFELDLYDGELFLIGDWARMVVARKLAGSEAGVIENTLDPQAMKGERGSILGVWTANLPGQYADLVFRPDGQFRLNRCIDGAAARDYGLYSVDMAARTLVSDSRFIEVQTHGLDFYGHTMTIFGGLGPPRTYAVNLGVVDAAIEASLASDEQEAAIDGQWLARVPVGPRDPNAVQIPTAEIPADPNPGQIFPAPTVLTDFRLYRRLIPGFVYFNDLGTIRSVAVVNTRAWYFFPTGRVLVRFRNHRAAGSYPITAVDVSDSWGAYRVEPKPQQTDILHIYADNALFIETDPGEQAEMTLEDGRRNLFWTKDFQVLSDWAAEQQPVPCESPADTDASLMNSPLSLSTTIEPDPTEGL